MLEFNILKGQYLNRLDKNVVSADTTDLKAQFDLTSDFTGTITVWWRRSDVNNTYTSTLAADGTCTIPAEALAATDKAVYGPYDHDVFVSISDTGRTTTSEYKLTVQRSAFSTDATPGTGGSPTAYEELVEQFDELKADNQTFKDNMTEQQETFESTVTENVDNIRYVVETETAPPIIEEASGAEITLDDSAYRQVRGLNLYGYSKQVKTTGAQLIDLASKGTTQNGVTFTIKEDGGIVANGTATSATALAMNVPSHPSSGQYYLSGCPSGGSNATYRIELRDASGAVLHADEGSGSAFTVSQEVSIADIRIASGYTCNNLVFYPMLNSGTSALPWEPYSGGVASPSPDWAQPIHSVADGGSVTARSEGVNLIEFGPNRDSVTSNGVTFKNLKDGRILVTGTCTADSYASFTVATQSQLKLVNGTYFLSGCPAGGSWSTFYLQMNKSTASGESIFDTGNGSSVDFAQEGNSYGVFIIVRSGYTCNGLIFEPMLIRSSTPLPWQPYVAPSSALIALTDSLRGIPVTSGGNYTDDDGQQWLADYIYRRQTDGKWMLWRNCGRAEYIGGDDESWTREALSFPRFVTPSRISNALATTVGRSMVICNRGRYHRNATETGYAFIARGPKFYYYPDRSIDTVGSFKTWLQSNPLEVVYQLATPTIEELPENVQTELNGLYTYNLHTDMWNNDGAYMDLKYVADTKTWINNKIAGLSTAMIENL